MALGASNMPDLRTRLTLDTSDFTTGLVHARGEARLFGREIGGVANHFSTAAVAMATFATVSLFTAGIIATAFMASIGVLMTLGVVSAFQAESVQEAWGQTGEHLRKGMLDAARSYVPVLERLAERTRTVFDSVQPAITQVFDRLAPVFEDLAVSFMDWFADLILRMPSMVNNALDFLNEIAPAWDAFTDNMRAGWDEMYQAVIEFGPTILKDGLPPFGEFIGNLLSMLGSVIEAAAQLSGPFFTALAVVSDALKIAWADVIAEITPSLADFGGTLENLGLGLVALLDGIGPQLRGMIDELVHLGPFVQAMFTGLGPVLEGLLQVVIETNQHLMPLWESLSVFIPQLGMVLVSVARVASAFIGGFIEGIAPLIGVLGDVTWSEALIMGLEAIIPAARMVGQIFGEITTFVVTAVGAVLNAVSAITDGVLGLTGLFGDAGFNAGRALVVGIIAGLGFMISPLMGIVAGLVAAIAMFLPRSPAEEGPLSGDGSPDARGRKLGEMFAEGIASSTGLVTAAAQQLANSVAMPMMPAAPGASGTPVIPMSGGGGSVQNIYVTVQGSVISERELQAAIQEAALRKESRNAGSTLATSVRS
jgi:hypothetical protein